MRSHELEIFADFFQFYIQDEATGSDLSDAWNQGAVGRMFATAPGVIGIGTVRNMNVPVTVEIHDSEPLEDLSAFDHVVEGSLSVRGNRIVVAGCTEYFPDAARHEIAPGIYRARISCQGLDTLSENGVEGMERYRVQLWPAPPIEPTVIKQRTVQHK